MDTKIIGRYQGRCGKGNRGAENNILKFAAFLSENFKANNTGAAYDVSSSEQ